MKNYLNILQKLVNKYESGQFKSDRTGVGTVSLFGEQLRFNLQGGVVPLLTTKQLHLKSIIHELVWFFKGESNIKYLRENGVRIWDEWADSEGNLGPVYPTMWRQWPDFVEDLDIDTEFTGGYNVFIPSKGIDQLQIAIDTIRKNPTSRRNIVSSWNPSLLPDISISPSQNASLGRQALPPCHTLFQFNCEEIPLKDRQELYRNCIHANDFIDSANSWNGKSSWLDQVGVPKYYLDCQLYQRSADWFLGVPFNIASYSILTHIIGKLTNTYPREFIHTFGDHHLYLNHIDQAREQLSRSIIDSQPIIILDDSNWNNNINNIKYEDISITNYKAHSSIKAPVAV